MKISELCSLQRAFQVVVYEQCSAHIHAIHTCLGKNVFLFQLSLDQRAVWEQTVLLGKRPVWFPSVGYFVLRIAVLSLGCVVCESHMQQPVLKALNSKIQMLIFNLPFLWRLFTGLSKCTAEQDCCSIQSISAGSRGHCTEPGGSSGGWPPSPWCGVGTGRPWGPSQPRPFCDCVR